MCLCSQGYKQSRPSVIHIREPISHILTKSNFSLTDSHFLQIKDTAKGTTKWRPHMPTFSMSDLEEKLLPSAPSRPQVWWRFIDGISSIWCGGQDSLDKFIDRKLSPPLTSEYSLTSVNFLDVAMTKSPNGMVTDAYTANPLTPTSTFSPTVATLVTVRSQLLTVRPCA